MKDVNKIKGALYGVAIGDAFGATQEFLCPSNANQIDIVGGGPHKLTPGDVTDDTMMTLCVARGIVQNPNNPYPHIGENFIKWVNTQPEDIGVTCAMTINEVIDNYNDIATLQQWWECAENIDYELNHKTDGNGALMRTIYPALFYNSLTTANDVSYNIAKMTHWGELSAQCCVKYTTAVWKLIRNQPILVDDVEEHGYSGYVRDAWQICCENINTPFENAIIKVGNMADDSDTNCAILGGLLGAKYGFDSIPQRWVNTLSNDIKEQLDIFCEIAED